MSRQTLRVTRNSQVEKAAPEPFERAVHLDPDLLRRVLRGLGIAEEPVRVRIDCVGVRSYERLERPHVACRGPCHQVRVVACMFGHAIPSSTRRVPVRFTDS
jgi:hypothetical protein